MRPACLLSVYMYAISHKKQGKFSVCERLELFQTEIGRTLKLKCKSTTSLFPFYYVALFMIFLGCETYDWSQLSKYISHYCFAFHSLHYYNVVAIMSLHYARRQLS